VESSDALMCVDEATANLTAALKSKRMWDNTLLLWTSDNGGVLVEQGNNSPLRGGKATLFEGGLRVLSFVSGGLLPATAPRRLDSIISIADWYSTFAKLATGVEPRDPKAHMHGLPAIDSRDVWPQLAGGGSDKGAGGATQQTSMGGAGRERSAIAAFSESGKVQGEEEDGGGVRTELLLSYVAHTPQGRPLPPFFSFANGTRREGRGESVAYVRGKYKLLGRDLYKGAPAIVNGIVSHKRSKDVAVAKGLKTGWTSRGDCAVEPDRDAASTAMYLLFDLDADPAERRDLAAQRPELLAEMVARVDALGAESYQTPTHGASYGLRCVKREEADEAYGGYYGPLCAEGEEFFATRKAEVIAFRRRRGRRQQEQQEQHEHKQEQQQEKQEQQEQ